MNTGNQHKRLSLKLDLLCFGFPSIPEEMQINLDNSPGADGGRPGMKEDHSVKSTFPSLLGDAY